MKNNTIKCKKLSTIVSGWKKVARTFFRRKQVSANTYVFSTRKKCCEFLEFDDIIFQSFTKPFFKTPIFDAPLTNIIQNEILFFELMKQARIMLERHRNASFHKPSFLCPKTKIWLTYPSIDQMKCFWTTVWRWIQ